MDCVRIRLKTKQDGMTVLNCNSIVESDGILQITFSQKYSNIGIGDRLLFVREILNPNNNIYSIVGTHEVTILSVSLNNLSQTVVEVEAIEDTRLYVTNVTTTTDGKYYRLELDGVNTIYAQDILTKSGNVYFKDENNGYTGNVCSTSAVYFYDSDAYVFENVVSASWHLYDVVEEVSFNLCEDEITYKVTPNYYYVHRNDYRELLYIGVNGLQCNVENLYKGIYFPFNLFYYKNGNDCILWQDYTNYSSPGNISGKTTYYNSLPRDYVYSLSYVADDDESYKVSMGFSQNCDYKHLYQEQMVTDIFTAKIKGSVVGSAPVIDMERVKFAPYIEEPTDTTDGISASALTFNLHFRVREDLQESWRYDKASIDYWNTVKDYVNLDVDSDEVRSSDVLYYLGFTDNDVKNQKLKIKKSFLRLSFYDDTNPLTQKLLYYSTVFMDSGELFGKYVKAKAELKKSGITTDEVVLDSSALTDNKLDCSFTIRDEYYTEKCSEGFNIYYFPSDVIATENSGKTIYMKVEFNHAGFGRTIPMIVCGGDLTSLSLNNYREHLYIPLTLKYINGKYIYLVETDNGTTVKKENDKATIEFDLFEPKIDAT